MAYLQVENLQVNYGAIKAVQGVSFRVEKGEIVTLIGANGGGAVSETEGTVRPGGGDSLRQRICGGEWQDQHFGYGKRAGR